MFPRGFKELTERTVDELVFLCEMSIPQSLFEEGMVDCPAAVKQTRPNNQPHFDRSEGVELLQKVAELAGSAGLGKILHRAVSPHKAGHQSPVEFELAGGQGGCPLEEVDEELVDGVKLQLPLLCLEVAPNVLYLIVIESAAELPQQFQKGRLGYETVHFVVSRMQLFPTGQL
jgi:hypothetical protein